MRGTLIVCRRRMMVYFFPVSFYNGCIPMGEEPGITAVRGGCLCDAGGIKNIREEAL